MANLFEATIADGSGGNKKKASETTAGALNTAAVSNPTLQYGSKGDAVRNLQTILNGYGYGLTVDGDFGSNTRNAVLDYQKKNGLTADGIVGMNTWGALNTKPVVANTPGGTVGAVTASPGELRAEAQAPTATAKTAGALTEKIQDNLGKQTVIPDYNKILNDLSEQNPTVTKDTVSLMTVPEVPKTELGKNTGTSGAVSDGEKNSGIPSTAGVKPQAVAYDDGGIDYKAITEDTAAKLGLPDLTPTDPVTPTSPAAPITPSAPETSTPRPITAADILSIYDAQNGTQETPTGSQYDATAALDTVPSGYTPPERNPYYEPNYRRILEDMEAYPQFQYDPNSDPIWASVAKQYRREGQRATADTLGQYAAMTGGIPSTAAVAAASQAGDYYGAQLSDRLQDVYNSAYQRYLDQYTRMMGLADQYRSGMDFEEGQFTGDRNFGYGKYYDDRNFDWNKYLSDRDFDYQKETDQYNRERTAQADAQERVAAYLSMGGDPANIPADILSQSGYSTAELQQMRSYYAQQAALQTAKASGGSSGSGSGGSSGGSGSGSEVESEYADVDVTKLPEGDQAKIVSSLRKMYPGGVIDSDDWRVVTQEFDPQWLAANGFSERSMTGEYNAEANQPTAEYNIGTAIEKAVSNYGAAKDFLTRNGASQSVINGLRKQSSLGLDNDTYKQYLRDYIDGFLNGFKTPSYNQTVNDLAAANPQVSGDVLSMLYTPTR